MNLEYDYFNKNIPIPNFIIDSGRGLYLVWLINSVPSKALPLWKAVQEYFYSQLKSLGADRQALDATRILRVPGSINSKTKSVVNIIDEYEYIYDLREIQKEFLQELRPYEKKKGRPSKLNFIFRERSLYYSRIQDIIKLCEIREYDLKGHREIILFLYRYWLCVFTEDINKALDDVLELNSMFIQPLREKDVRNATKSAEKCFRDNNKEYRYKNETLINILDITEDEQTHMSTIISKYEYKRRKKIRDREYQRQKYKIKLKSKGQLTKSEQLEKTRKKIKSLREQGLKNKDICIELDLAESTLKRHITYMKKNGLIK